MLPSRSYLQMSLKGREKKNQLYMNLLLLLGMTPTDKKANKSRACSLSNVERLNPPRGV
jgi:hypothetical protein